MSEQQYFQFTLGPVQGFVAQARRTWDFWAGSFLLSWLAGVAMKAVEAQNGKIEFPAVKRQTLDWLEGKGLREPPRQGSIPNRFKASVGPDFEPQKVVESVQTAWRELAELVWQEDLAHPCATHPETREIWNRQIESFWEISWVMGGESNLLDRRKNWRNHLPRPEGGVKCMVMEGWQELSGEDRPHAAGLKEFWKRIRRECKEGGSLDLAEGEYLSAIAFIKRRFVHYFRNLEVPLTDGPTLKGWPLKGGAPSVLHLAAAHWLERMIKDRDPRQLADFVEKAKPLGQGGGQAVLDLACIQQACRDSADPAMARKLAQLDSNLLFVSSLENSRLWEGKSTKQTVAALKELAQGDHPAPFYAVLLMDGDFLGKHMSNPARQPTITEALEQFTGSVPDIVSKHNGFLIYAGGDDVLALLPLEDALACADELRTSYVAAFAESSKRPDREAVESTLSGAIEYAHIRMPLTRVLKDAHQLLDEVAKDGRGRDAIAVRVWKPSGQALEWAMPWKYATCNNRVVVDQLAADVRYLQEKAPDFSSKFFYRIRERFTLLNPAKKDEPPILSEEHAIDLLAVDYLASGVNRESDTKLTLDQAKERIEPLLKQCRPRYRNPDKPKDEAGSSNRLEEDAALLVRFLAQKGVER